MTRKYLLTVVCCLATALAVACDSGGPPAVPGPRVAATAPSADVVYYTSYSGNNTLHLATVSVDQPGVRAGTRVFFGPVSFASDGAHLFAASAPVQGAGKGTLTVEEMDPLSLETVCVLATYPLTRIASLATIALSRDGSLLYLARDGDAAEEFAGRLDALSTVDGATIASVPLALGREWRDVALMPGSDGSLAYIEADMGGERVSGQALVIADGRTLAPIRRTALAAGDSRFPCRGERAGPFADGTIACILPGTEERVSLLKLPEGDALALPETGGEPWEWTLWADLVVSRSGTDAYWLQASGSPAVTRLSPETLAVTATLDSLPEPALRREDGSIAERLAGALFGWLQARPGEAKLAPVMGGVTSLDDRFLYFTVLIPSGGVDHYASGLWELDTETMRITRQLAAGRVIIGQPFLGPDGRRLYVLDEEGTFFGVSLETGELLFEEDPVGEYPVGIVGVRGLPWSWEVPR